MNKIKKAINASRSITRAHHHHHHDHHDGAGSDHSLSSSLKHDPRLHPPSAMHAHAKSHNHHHHHSKGVCFETDSETSNNNTHNNHHPGDGEHEYDPRLTVHDVQLLIACYHKNHECTKSFWGVHHMLEEECHIAISPPFLAMMLERVGMPDPQIIVDLQNKEQFAQPPQKGDMDAELQARHQEEHFFLTEHAFIDLVTLIRFDDIARDEYLDSDAHLLDLAYSEMEPNERGCIASEKLGRFLDMFSLRDSKSGLGAIVHSAGNKELSLKKLTATLYKAPHGGHRHHGHGKSGKGATVSAMVQGPDTRPQGLNRRDSLPDFSVSMIGDAASTMEPGDTSPTHDEDNPFAQFTSLRNAALLLPAIGSPGGRSASVASSGSEGDRRKTLHRRRTIKAGLEDDVGKIQMFSRSNVTQNYNDRIDYSKQGGMDAFASSRNMSSSRKMSRQLSRRRSTGRGLNSGSDVNLTARDANDGMPTPLDIGGLVASNLQTPHDGVLAPLDGSVMGSGLDNGLNGSRSLRDGTTPSSSILSRRLSAAATGGSIVAPPIGSRRRVSILNSQQSRSLGTPQSQQHHNLDLSSRRSSSHRSRSSSLSDRERHGRPRRRSSTAGPAGAVGMVPEAMFEAFASSADAPLEKSIFYSDSDDDDQEHNEEDQEDLVEVVDETGRVMFVDGAGHPLVPHLSHYESRRSRLTRLRSKPWKKKRQYLTEEMNGKVKVRRKLKKAGVMSVDNFKTGVKELRLKDYPTYHLLDQTAKRLHGIEEGELPPVERPKHLSATELMKAGNDVVAASPNKLLSRWVTSGTSPSAAVASTPAGKKLSASSTMRSTPSTLAHRSGGGRKAATPSPAPAKRLRL